MCRPELWSPRGCCRQQTEAGEPTGWGGSWQVRQHEPRVMESSTNQVWAFFSMTLGPSETINLIPACGQGLKASLRIPSPQLTRLSLLLSSPEPAAPELSGISIKMSRSQKSFSTSVMPRPSHQASDIWPSIWEGADLSGSAGKWHMSYYNGCVTVNYFVNVPSPLLCTEKHKGRQITQGTTTLFGSAKAWIGDAYWLLLKCLFNILARSDIPMALQSLQINAPAVLVF